MTDNIISFEKALAGRKWATNADDAPVAASMEMERALITAVKAWLEKPKSADEQRFNDEEWADVIFYGGAYFIRFWAMLVEANESTDTEQLAFIKKLRALLGEGA